MRKLMVITIMLACTALAQKREKAPNGDIVTTYPDGSTVTTNPEAFARNGGDLNKAPKCQKVQCEDGVEMLICDCPKCSTECGEAKVNEPPPDPVEEPAPRGNRI